jgi:hypothetical protein
MKILKSPVFLICCILFIAHQALRLINDQPIPLVDPYLDTLLAMPIILTFLLFERRYIFKWKNYVRLTGLEIILATLLIAFVSEVVFPALSDEFTGDWMDVLFYFAGSAIFYFTINPRNP